MLNELLPENMRQVIEFASTHPVTCIIKKYHDDIILNINSFL
jgi:hypothetical protein